MDDGLKVIFENVLEPNFEWEYVKSLINRERVKERERKTKK